MVKMAILLAAVFLSVLPAGCVNSVSFDDLTQNALDYNGMQVCTEGVYLSGFEVSALGKLAEQRNNNTYLTEPAIWIEGINVEKRECFKTETLFPFEFCNAKVCGIFEYGDKYGHLGDYNYQIS
jgi:hypothetical protein